MSTTSSQRPNLRPTSRSTPTSSKPHASMQPDRRLVAPDDAGHDGVEAVGAGEGDQLGEQAPADALAPRLVVDVDRVLDGGAVGRPGPVRRQGTEAAHAIEVVDGDHGRVGAAVLVHPGQLVLERSGAPGRR